MNRLVACTARGVRILSRNLSMLSTQSKAGFSKTPKLSLFPRAKPKSSLRPLEDNDSTYLGVFCIGTLGVTLVSMFAIRQMLPAGHGMNDEVHEDKFGRSYKAVARKEVVPTSLDGTEVKDSPPVQGKEEEIVVATPDIVEPGFFPEHAQYLIIGAGTAAHSAFEVIKGRDPQAKVWVIGKENHVTYARPPLSKNFWYISPEALTKSLERNFAPGSRNIYYEPESFYFSPEKLLENENGGVCIIRNQKVARLDPDNKKVFLESGKEISYDKCLIATGGTPRNLPIFKNAPKKIQDRVVLFRTIDDFNSLYESTSTAQSIVVVGGGFLGSELAVSLQNRVTTQNTGATVTQVFPEKGNLGLVLPSILSQWLTSHIESEGVHVMSERTVSSVGFEDNQVLLTLSDDTQLKADRVLVAVGLEPSVDLAVTSGLEVDSNLGGFLVNSELEARSNLWVAGDAACFYDRKLGRRRVEHYDNAQQSGRIAGQNMTGGGLPYTYQSMFWSDIGDVGLEAVGLADSKLDTMVYSVPKEGVEDGKNKKVVFYERGNDVVGILTVNIKRKADLAQKFIESGLKAIDTAEAFKHFYAEKEEKKMEKTEKATEGASEESSADS